MKRIIFAALIAVGCTAALASAQAPIQQMNYGPLVGKTVSGSGGCVGCGTGVAAHGPVAGCPSCGDKRFGLHPMFTRLMFWKRNTPCGSCGGIAGKLGCKGGNCAGVPTGGGAAFNPYPNGTPGTLVFPYNPYIRSPRDWFQGADR